MADEHVPTRDVVYLEPVSDPLIAFFWARLDEAEELAREAPGEWDQRVERAEYWINQSDEPLDWEEMHIVQHAPKRVLGDVAAKKAILDDYARYCADVDNPAREMICQVTRDVIKHLATVHAGHPDYDEAWRP